MVLGEVDLDGDAHERLIARRRLRKMGHPALLVATVDEAPESRVHARHAKHDGDVVVHMVVRGEADDCADFLAALHDFALSRLCPRDDCGLADERGVVSAVHRESEFRFLYRLVDGGGPRIFFVALADDARRIPHLVSSNSPNIIVQVGESVATISQFIKYWQMIANRVCCLERVPVSW